MAGFPTRIVVGTDGSDTASVAVAHAVGLAERTGAEVVVVSGSPRGTPEDEAQLAVSRSILRDAVRKHRTACHIRPAVATGDPARALLDVARDEGADLIVVGNRGMSKRRLALGGVAERVTQRAPCSVLLVNTKWAIITSGEDLHETTIPRRILLATDGSETAARALEAGAELARATGAEAVVFSAGPDAERVAAEAADLLSDGIPVSVATGRGDPAEAIVEAARAEGCDLVVIGNKGARRRLLQSIPNHVVHKAQTNVLVVKTTR